MALNEITVIRNDYVFWGRRNFIGLTGNVRLDIYEQIQTDIEFYFDPPERAAATVLFTPLIEITDFDSSVVQTYGGFPPRRRFGEYSLFNADCSIEYKFLTYEKQQLMRGRTFIVNGVDSPLSLFDDEAAVPLENTWTLLLSDTFANPEAPVSTGLEFQLNNSVSCNCSIFYGGQMTRYFDGEFFPLQTYTNV